MNCVSCKQRGISSSCSNLPARPWAYQPPIPCLILLLLGLLVIVDGDDWGDLSRLVPGSFVFTGEGNLSFVLLSSPFTDHHRCPFHSADDPSPGLYCKEEGKENTL